MSKDFNDISKEIIKTNKQIHDIDKNISKDVDNITKELGLIKKDIKILQSKVDDIIDILNTLTIFIVDENEEISEDDTEDKYESNEGWLPEMNNWEDNYNPDDEDEEI